MVCEYNAGDEYPSSDEVVCIAARTSCNHHFLLAGDPDDRYIHTHFDDQITYSPTDPDHPFLSNCDTAGLSYAARADRRR